MNLNRFDESIECHQKAVDCLIDVLNTTTLQKSIDSLELQRDYHLKYKELVRMKRTQYERYRSGLQFKNIKSDEIPTCIEKHVVDSVQVQTELYQTLEDTDVLLVNLSQSLRETVYKPKQLEMVFDESQAQAQADDSEQEPVGDSDQAQANDSEQTQAEDSKQTQAEDSETSDVKYINDDLSAINEMRKLNHQLHFLVFQLVSQLDERNLETTVLRERVKVMEKEPINAVPHYTPLPSNPSKRPSSNRLTIVSTTPPNIDYSTPRICELAPLELPKFDLNDFIKKT